MPDQASISTDQMPLGRDADLKPQWSLILYNL